MSNQPIVLYVDGACKGNPGLGGWGVYIEHPDGRTEEHCGGDKQTTNNRMELTAALQGLIQTQGAASILVWTDSSYVQKGISEWIHGWKKKNWRKADGSAVLNADLWQQLDQAAQGRQIDWRWIKGHAGHAGNEKADQLANLGTTRSMSKSHPASSSPSPKTIDEPEPVMSGHTSNNPNHDAQPSVNDSTDWLRNDPLGFDLEHFADDDMEMVTSSNTHAGDDLNTHLPDLDPFDLDPINTDPADHAIDWQAIDTARAETPIPSAPINTASVQPTASTSATSPIQDRLPRASHGPRQLILDTETTGFDPAQGDRVIEIGIIEMVERKLTGNSMHVYLNPQRAVGDSAAIHGLTDEFLADKALFDSIADQLIDFVDGAELIAHNANFDMNFLEAELRRCGRPALADRVQVTDTLAMAKRKHAGQKNSLDALVKRYDIKPRDRQYHGALLDAEILADVYLAMTGGQVSLDMGQSELQTAQNGHRKLYGRKLRVISAAQTEHELHHAWLDQLEGKSGNVSIWRDQGLA